MDINIPDIGIELPDIDQVALVVEDLDDSMKRYHQILGIGPWTVFSFEPPELTDTTYRGEEVEYGMMLAIADIGDTMLELIEPTISPNIYRDYLDEHGEGLHHVGYFSWNKSEIYEVIDKFDQADIPILQSGHYVGTDFWYFDTADELNGLIFETAHRKEVSEREPLYVYPEN
jgi:catechol 2,3-dioxygenase-like lactoylglutathione lyase family enzyme